MITRFAKKNAEAHSVVGSVSTFSKSVCLWVLLILTVSVNAMAEEQSLGRDKAFYGAKIFTERCSLCHGNDAMGDGILPLLEEGYPTTNLLDGRYGTKPDDIKKIVLWGGSKGAMNELSPPWVEELSAFEIDAVVAFVVLLHRDSDSALDMLDAETDKLIPSLERGDRVFRSRCVICHGANGEGDGRLSVMINSPPPSNLRTSLASAEYMTKIVSQGGSSVGRSQQMPPWAGTLRLPDIESVVLYLNSIRSEQKEKEL